VVIKILSGGLCEKEDGNVRGGTSAWGEAGTGQKLETTTIKKRLDRPAKQKLTRWKRRSGEEKRV